MTENYKLELSSASLRTWNDGMASFGRINAYGGIKLSIVNCQLLIVNEISTHSLLRNINYKQVTKGRHGLHQSSFKLQTMTAIIKSFCRGVQGGQFFQKAPPLAAGGRGVRYGY